MPESSSSPSGSSTSSPSLHYLPMNKDEAPPMYVCRKCGTHLALQDELISKSFSGRNGKAYLFHSSINTVLGPAEDRNLLTGMHTVADMRCKGCQGLVGWTYLKAWEGGQKYKEGRFIIEHSAIHKVNNWS